MSKNNNPLENVILTRFKNPSSMEGLLTDEAELIPSLAAHRYSPASNNHAFAFGDYGLLGNPEWLDPQKNIVYARDADTPLSPVSMRLPDKKGYEKLRSEFGDIPKNDLSKIENINGFFMNHNMSPEAREISQNEAEKRFLKQYPNYPMDEMGKAQALGSYLSDLYSFLRENGSEVSFPIPTDEKSLRDHILNDNKPFWEQHTEEAGKPLSNMEDVARVADKLTEKNIHWLEQRDKIENILRRNLEKQFKGVIPSEIDRRLKNNIYDRNKDPVAKRISYNPQMQDGDLENFLENVNGIVRGENNKVSKQERAAGNSIKRMETPFMEIKVPRMVKSTDYIGAIYPRGKNSLNDKINDIYGQNAIPYKKYYDAEQTNQSKMAALGELMRRAGLMGKDE